uniref:Uncharacterized protein n=2 Tax=Astyanax mexicanus TaxID=7994 RepID=A0A8B9J4G2_ASTMX
MADQSYYSPSFKKPSEVLRMRRKRARSEGVSAGSGGAAPGSAGLAGVRPFSPGPLLLKGPVRTGSGGAVKRRNPFANIENTYNSPGKRRAVSCAAEEFCSPTQNVSFSEEDSLFEEDLFGEYPADWSLKTRLLFTSPHSFSWAEHLKAQEEAQGLSLHCRAEYASLPLNIQVIFTFYLRTPRGCFVAPWWSTAHRLRNPALGCLSLSFCLSLCLCPSLFHSLSLPLFLFVSLSLSFAPYLFFFPLSLPVFVSLSFFPSVSFCLKVSSGFLITAVLRIELYFLALTLKLLQTLSNVLFFFFYFRRKEHNEVRLDHRPESVVLVEGSNTFTLINFLINCKSLVAGAGSQAGLPPTLLAPTAFRGATLQMLKVIHYNGLLLCGLQQSTVQQLVEPTVLGKSALRQLHMRDFSYSWNS